VWSERTPDRKRGGQSDGEPSNHLCPRNMGSIAGAGWSAKGSEGLARRRYCPVCILALYPCTFARYGSAL
jgi:hypothetical protein